MGEISRSDVMMAWQQTVVDHGSWLRGLITARLDPGEPVEDILQETLQSAIERGQPGGTASGCQRLAGRDRA